MDNMKFSLIEARSRMVSFRSHGLESKNVWEKADQWMQNYYQMQARTSGVLLYSKVAIYNTQVLYTLES